VKRTALRTSLICLLCPLSCLATAPVAQRLSEPLTHKAVDPSSTEPFPVLVIQGDAARVVMTRVGETPDLPSDASFLVPAGAEGRIQNHLNQTPSTGRDGGWVLNVTALAPDRQHVELFWMADGYSGGGYEATATTITPRYRKITGPGFALVLLEKMILLALPLWGIASGLVWWATRVRAAVARQAGAAH